MKEQLKKSINTLTEAGVNEESPLYLYMRDDLMGKVELEPPKRLQIIGVDKRLLPDKTDWILSAEKM